MSTRDSGDGTRPGEPEPARSSASEQQPPPTADRSAPVPAGSGSAADERSGAEPAQPEPTEAGDRSTPTSSTPGTTPGSDADPRRLATPPRRGSLQRQEAGVTQPRPPTVAEARARDKARKRAEEAQRAAAEAEEAKKRTRKRVMIGGVAIVGVAALVGGGYLAYRALTAPDRVTAYCVRTENGQEIVVDDAYCGDGRPGFVSDTDSRSGPGVVFLGGGPQYRYYYGGTGTVGKSPTGGTTIKPRSAEIKTKSGTTVQRGGLGSKSTGGGS